jgi:8-hydroxy-5-deazaflavin:NADPH oxidoreductase
VNVAVIGTGNIGSRVARDLRAGGQNVIVAANNVGGAQALAKDLGPLAKAASVPDAIRAADAIIFAVWFDVMRTLIALNAGALDGKVVFDPSNPIQPDGKGGFVRTLPDGQSSGEIVAALLPKGAHFVKAFGSVAAEALEQWSRRQPKRAVLFYATDDDLAAKAAQELITVAGFDPIRAGGVDASIRIEVFGDLHAFGGLNGNPVTADEARALVGTSPAVSS